MRQTKRPWHYPEARAAVVLLAVLAVVSARAQTSSDAPGVRADAGNENILMTPELRADLLVSEVKHRTLGVLTQAQVRVENTSRARYSLEYKFQWTDEDGFEAGTTRTWHRFVLPPGQRELISSTGQVPEAKNAIFSLRLPEDHFLGNDKEPPWREQDINEVPPNTEPKGDNPNEIPGR